MSGTWRRLAAAATFSAALVAAPALIPAQDAKPADEPAKGDAARKGPAEGLKAAGVILKVEPIVEGATEGSTIDRLAKEGKKLPRECRLTINMNVPWRDWVRDQATNPKGEPAEKQAEEGEQSVATKGEPADQPNLVVVDLAPETKVETRFRASTDETNEGSKTPAEAIEAQADPADDRPARKKDAGGDSGKKETTQFDADDLKPGLFVEVEYRHTRAHNRATVVRVLRPVGGPDTPPGAVTPAKAKAKSEDRPER